MYIPPRTASTGQYKYIIYTWYRCVLYYNDSGTTFNVYGLLSSQLSHVTLADFITDTMFLYQVLVTS